MTVMKVGLQPYLGPEDVINGIAVVTDFRLGSTGAHNDQ